MNVSAAQRPARRVLSLVLAGSLLLTSCSGSGGSIPIAPGAAPPASGNPNIGMISGTVQLPAGSHIVLATLQVVNSLGGTHVANDGAFGFEAFRSGPQLAQVIDAGGAPMMAGFLSTSEPAVNARTTAEALIYFAAGFFTLPAELQQQAYAQIAAAPGFSAVEAAVSADLVAGTGAFANTHASLAAFVATLSVPDSPSAAFYKAATSGDKAPSGLLVDPSNGQSGVTVINNSPQMYFHNTSRRMALAYIDQVSYADSNGGNISITKVPKIDAVAPTIAIDGTLDAAGAWGALAGCSASTTCISATTPLKSFSGTLVDLAYGNTAFAPISTSDLVLPTVGSLWTRYRITVVGPGAAGRNITTPLTAEQQSGLDLVSGYFLMQNFVVPLLVGVLLPIGASLSNSPLLTNQSGAFGDLVNTLLSTAPDVAVAARGGDIGLALTKAMTAIFSSNTLKQKVIDALLVYADNNAQYFFDGAGYTSSNLLASELSNTLMKTTGVADVVLQGIDLAKVGSDLLGADSADEFTVYVLPTQITLTPSASTVDNDAGVNLTASVGIPAESDLSLEYTWSNTALFGHFKDLSGNAGHVDNFTSTQNQGTYTANHTGGGTDTVRVSVIAADSSGDRIEHIPLGAASATVSIATPGPNDVGTPPSLPQSRCAPMSVSPHVAPINGSFSATTVGHPESCGGAASWYWTTGGGVTITSGCTENATSCVLKATYATGIPGYRYVNLCLQGNSTQGGWQSCDYYAVTPS